MAARRSAEACLEHAQLADGDRECRRAIEILDDLAACSSDRQIRFEQAAALETLALIRSASEEPEKADAFFRKAIGVLDPAARRRSGCCAGPLATGEMSVAPRHALELSGPLGGSRKHARARR